MNLYAYTPCSVEMTVEKKALLRDLTVEVVLERWPETVSVFHNFKTACVGCAMARFDTVEDVARIYKLDLSRFLEALQSKIAAGDGAQPD